MIASDSTYANIFDSTKTIFNFNREDIDFRVNTDDYQGTLFIDANDNTIIMGNQDFDASPTAAEVSGYGTDVKLYLSGTTGTKDSATRGVTLIAGDLVTSGATHLQGDLFVSGNTRFVDEIIIAENKKVYFDGNGVSNGPFIRGNTTALTIDGDDRIFVYYDDYVEFTAAASTGSAIHLNNDGRVLIHSGGAVSSFNEAAAADVSFYVSGSSGSKGTTRRGTSVFGGDLVVSGNIFDSAGNSVGGITIDNDVNNRILTAKGVTNNINGETNLLFTGNQLTANAFISASSGLNIQQSKTSIVGIRVGSSTSEPPVCLNTIFDDDLRFNVGGNTYGNDVGVLISGSVGSKDTTESKGVTLIAGDLVLSGNVYDKSGNDYIKDVEKGSVLASLGATTKQYFPADDQQTESTSIQYYSFVAPVFSGSFNTIGLRAYGTTGFSQLSDLGGITASFHRGFPGTDPQSIDTSPDFIEDVFINLASHTQNTTLQINFSGSNFNPGDTYAWAIKPDNNWNNGGNKYLAYTVITSHKVNQ